ncbi:MAG: T9SS type A sorting domain-containing protein [Ignavibacteriaceae bacterium]|nr:T9SS type A sorting domain-containing protein [Ignavibacteriaceae bacterium]
MRTLKISLLVFILSITSSAQWEWRNPLPQANSLKKIFFTDSSTGWVVGDKGTFVKTTDGSEWRAIYFDSIRANIKSISFINKNFGWAVSGLDGNTQEGRVFKTSDAGQSWSQIYFFNKILYDVKFISENIGWVVGFGIISKTTDGGISWNDQMLDPTAKFYSCFFQNSLRGWATGYSGTEVYHTGDGGLTWVKQNLDSAATYFSISFADSMNGWIAGNSVSNSASLFKTIDGGSNWFEYPLVNPGLTSITFISSSSGWISDRAGNILKTTDGGNNWVTASGLGSYINNIFFIDTLTGWLIHSSGAIRKTIDGGFTWVAQSSGFRFSASAFFIDSLKGTIIAPGPELWYTQDGGFTWTVSWVHGYADYVHKITFIDSLYGWGCGYRHNPYPTQPGPLILKTTNGGQTWMSYQPPSLGIGEHLGLLEFVNRQIGFTDCAGIWRTTDGGWNWSLVCNTNNMIWDIFFLNSTTGWATQHGGIIYKTSDGGNSWEQILPGITIRKIFFLNENEGWGINDNGSTLMQTTDGGYTWQVQLNEAISITDYWISDENNVWLVPTSLKTTNGGQSWESYWHPSSYGIRSVQFIDNKIGWFAGQEGTILKYYNDETSSIETEINFYTTLNYSLSNNYPNPFNPVTKIKYTIPSVTLRQAQSDILVTLKVYDILGREIATLVNEEKPAGEYEIEFNAANLPSGIYFYQLRAGQYSETKKMILLK